MIKLSSRICAFIFLNKIEALKNQLIELIQMNKKQGIKVWKNAVRVILKKNKQF